MAQSAHAPIVVQYDDRAPSAAPAPAPADVGASQRLRLFRRISSRTLKNAKLAAKGKGGDEGGGLRNSLASHRSDSLQKCAAEGSDDGHLRGSLTSVQSVRSTSVDATSADATEAEEHPKARHRRRLPKVLRGSFPGGLGGNFRKKCGGGGAQPRSHCHSSHPLRTSGGPGLADLAENDPLRASTEHDESMTEALRQDRLLREGGEDSSCGTEGRGSEGGGSEGPGGTHVLDASEVESRSSVGSLSVLSLDSRAMLEGLGANPSRRDIAALAAVRASEYIEECFSADLTSALDRATWEAIPQYAKADLNVGAFLGKGSFSDVFEVVCAAPDDAGEDLPPTVESLGTDSLDLTALLETRFQGRRGSGGRVGAAAGVACPPPGGGGPGGAPSAKELGRLRAEFKRLSMCQELDEMEPPPGGGGVGGAPSAAELGALRAEFGARRSGDDGDEMELPPGGGGVGGAPSAAELGALRTEFGARRPGDPGPLRCQEMDGIGFEIGFGSLSPQKETGEDEESVEMDREIDAMFGKGSDLVAPSGDSLDKEIDAMFGGGGPPDAVPPMPSGDSLDDEFAAMFGGGDGRGDGGGDGGASNGFSTRLPSSPHQRGRGKSGRPPADDTETPQDFRPQASGLRRPEFRPEPDPPPPPRRVQRRERRVTMDVGAPTGLVRPAALSRRRDTADDTVDRRRSRSRQVTVAMKCLRPQIRSDAEQFIIGVEDLVHETAMLASLDHHNIIKLHGRAGAVDADSSLQLSDGYFILIDRLKDTLDDRVQRWKKSANRGVPSLSQIRTAGSIADALAYLHSKNIIFRDLKPANIGFDHGGVLKLFDFGFAVGIDDDLYDRCGTPRYMAPEVGLDLGYNLPADVYSFGILLWEICALKKPFGNVKSAAEFEEKVFEKGTRPRPCKSWPPELTRIIEECWGTDPTTRPTMMRVKTNMAALAKDMTNKTKREKTSLSSSIRRRISIG